MNKREWTIVEWGISGWKDALETSDEERNKNGLNIINPKSLKKKYLIKKSMINKNKKGLKKKNHALNIRYEDSPEMRT